MSEARASDRGREQLARWIRELSDIERPSATAGEQEAAAWVAAQLSAAGVDARIETERAQGTHLPFLLPSLVALLGGFVGRRRFAAAAAGLATLTIADELEGGAASCAARWLADAPTTSSPSSAMAALAHPCIRRAS